MRVQQRRSSRVDTYGPSIRPSPTIDPCAESGASPSAQRPSADRERWCALDRTSALSRAPDSPRRRGRADGELTGVEVDVVPLQTEQLSAASARRGCREPQRVEPWSLTEASHLVICPGVQTCISTCPCLGLMTSSAALRAMSRDRAAGRRGHV